jgi:hypothetical protein
MGWFKNKFRQIKRFPRWIYWLPARTLQLMCHTLYRIKIDDPDNLRFSKGGIIGLAWHNRLFFFPAIMPASSRKRTAAVVSASRDGQYIADLISMFGISIATMNTFAFGIRCAGPFAAYGLGLAVPKATKSSGVVSLFTGTIAFIVWQLYTGGDMTKGFGILPVVFGCFIGVITFFIVNLIGWKKGVAAAPSAYVEE